MSNTAVSLFSAAMPAHIANREINANTMALAGNAATGKRISIEGGVFRMIVGGKEVAKSKDRDMNIVIVKTAPANSRVYYDPSVPYVRGQATPPACTSLDGVRPDARVKTKQASSCDACPQNVAGSGTGDSRACRYNRRLAVVLEGDISGDVYQLTLPATSIFGKGTGTQNLPLEAFARMLASNRVNIDSVVTKMEFDTDSSTPKLTFSPTRYLSVQELAVAEQQGETPEADQAIGNETFAQPQAKASQLDLAPAIEYKPASKGFEPTTEADDDGEVVEAPPAKKTKAKPVVEDDVAEPTKAVKAEAPRAQAISNVLAAWGD